MSESKSACGPHVEVVRTDGVRIARCPCGTLHLTFQRSGVTLQVSPEYFDEIVQALALAKTIAEPAKVPVRVVPSPVTGTFVSIETPGFKKPSN
jgi:RNase P/RNase MRP subunit POP5